MADPNMGRKDAEIDNEVGGAVVSTKRNNDSCDARQSRENGAIGHDVSTAQHIHINEAQPIHFCESR
jgi:hypothetical protein